MRLTHLADSLPLSKYTSKVAFQLHDLGNRRLRSSFACGSEVLHLFNQLFVFRSQSEKRTTKSKKCTAANTLTWGTALVVSIRSTTLYGYIKTRADHRHYRPGWQLSGRVSAGAGLRRDRHDPTLQHGQFRAHPPHPGEDHTD